MPIQRDLDRSVPNADRNQARTARGPTLVRDVELDGELVDLRITGATITEVGRALLPVVGSLVIEGRGGAVIPGLNDHHLHLLAAAATLDSVDVGPEVVGTAADLHRVLRDADRSVGDSRWIRAVGYHAGSAGDLDRAAIDRMVAGRPVRIQDRSGARWTLNSAAVDRLGLAQVDHPGIERGDHGVPTGRLHRADGLLRDLLGDDSIPDIDAIGRRLAAVGVTGVADATPFETMGALTPLVEAHERGALPDDLMVMGGIELVDVPFPSSVRGGPVKIVIDDADYPALDDLVERVELAHAHGRNVAFHCVTRTALIMVLVALEQAGVLVGDRLEHASVVPAEVIPQIRSSGLRVVTQPTFVFERGDDYMIDVDPEDLGDLYRCRTLIDGGVPVAGSTDAPYTEMDPWRAMRSAVSRVSVGGTPVGAAEAVTPVQALGLFMSNLGDPGGPSRRVRVGARADLCVLDRPLRSALGRLSSEDVRYTISAGSVVHAR